MASSDRSSSPGRTSLLSLLGLTVSTGIVDAVNYLGLGHVFTANMTGNVVFLGFAAAGAPGLSILRSSTALAGFLVGAVLGGRLAKRMSSGPQHRWAATAIAVEAALLLAAAAASIGHPAAHPDTSAQVYVVIIITALAMGVRNAAVRTLGVLDLTTTVLTLTITGLAADSTFAGGSDPRWPRRIASVLAMSAGAVCGVLLLKCSLALPLAVCALVACSCAAAVYLAGRARSAGGI